MMMLCERMLTEGNGNALSVIFLDILECGPKLETRQTFEIPELLQFDRRLCGATNVSRLGSGPAERGLRWRWWRLAKVEQEGASRNGGEKHNYYNRKREITFHARRCYAQRECPILTVRSV